MKNISMRLTRNNIRKIPIFTVLLAAITMIFYSIYCYSDIIWTTKNGLTVWYCLFEKHSLGEFYITPYPLDSNNEQAYYDLFLYIIFAVWDIPLFIYEKITQVSFMDNYLTRWYAKTIILIFLMLCCRQTYTLTFKLTKDTEKANWSVFTFAFSTMVLYSIVVMGGYDVISLFFTLSGIIAYLDKKNKKFVLYFACAIACKMFALWIFIPLVLLKQKNVIRVLFSLLESMSLIIIPKLYFFLYGKINGINALGASMDTETSNVAYIYEYLWSGEAPFVLGGQWPLFFCFTFMLWFWCWFNRKELSDKLMVYICLLAMFIFLFTCDSHPQWIILLAPYIAILTCANWCKLPDKLFLETVAGISYLLWQVRRRPHCFSYNVVNNMLHIEEGDREFWFTGIWQFIDKFSEVLSMPIEQIWTLVRSVLIASFLMLIVYLFPKEKENIQYEEKKRKYLYIKAACCMSVMLIPLLGVYMRFRI